MMTFNEEHELVVLKALKDYLKNCKSMIAETGRFPKHCEFWCEETARAQSALDAADRYFRIKESR